MIPPGTRVVFGRPADPLPRTLADGIVAVVAEQAAFGIVEAHLPHTWIEGVMPEPSPVLILVVRSEEEVDLVAPAVGQGLSRILPADQELNILPMLIDDDLVELVRRADCKIFPTVDGPRATAR